MEKKQLEKYLVLYPKIDEKINNLENELKDIQEKIEKYENSDIDTPSSILTSLRTAYDSCKAELEETIKAKTVIREALHKATPTQRDIIEHKFWQRGRRTWSEVAATLNYHVKSVERLYGSFAKLVT